MSNFFWTLATFFLLAIFCFGMLKNLGNTAFWEDEGETVQLGKSILKYGYPSVFDGLSFFIIEEDLYRSDNFARYPSPYLQFYIAALVLKLTGGIGDTFLIRLPFALITITGIIFSVAIFYHLKTSRYVLFLYSFFIATSVQLYLYYRQARHYALQFTFAFALLYAYLNIHRRAGQIFFIILGFLSYHTFYPGFFALLGAISIHFLLRVRLYGEKIIVKPFIISTIILFSLVFPFFIYLHHYEQVPGSDLISNLIAYFYDLNYHAYFKFFLLSTFIIISVKWIQNRQVKFLLFNVKKFFKKNNFILLFFIIVFAYPALLSFGRHNARYVVILFPVGFMIVAYMWDKMLFLINKLSKLNLLFLKILSLPLLFYLINLSHPAFFSQIKFFHEEINSTYVGPLEAIVNIIVGKVPGSIDAYSALRPNLLIATNQEGGSLYAYLDSQFLNLKSFGEYKYGKRLPDWIIPRYADSTYYDQLYDLTNYQKVETQTCDLDFEQVYNVKTHRFKTPTNCSQYLTLYKLR